MTWMQRLKRVFAIDIETCPKCGGTLRVIACIENPDVIAAILEHVGAREAAATANPRAPPTTSHERSFNQSYFATIPFRAVIRPIRFLASDAGVTQLSAQEASCSPPFRAAVVDRPWRRRLR